MITKLTLALALTAPVVLTSLACAKEGGAEKPAAEVTPPPAAPKEVAPVLDTYEQMRAQLAGDQIAEAVASAKTLESAAKTGAKEGQESWRPHLEPLAEAAADLAKANAEEPDAVRKAYGEVSRHVVALLAADPALQQGRFLFECPMAQGYQKWVQLEKRMQNPYMGKRMLECGAESDWKV